MSATPMNAALAAQPDLLAASAREVRRLLALVEGGVPHVLDGCVLRVCQSFLAFFIKALQPWSGRCTFGGEFRGSAWTEMAAGWAG